VFNINEDTIISEIQKEYKKIDDKWLTLHYRTFIAVVFFGFLIECTLGVGLYFAGITEISMFQYSAKYILFPLLVNSALVLVGIMGMNSTKLKQKIKVYLISFLFVGVCFVFYTVHVIFDSLFVIFTAPILLTVVYSDYALTSYTALLGISAKVISELFIVWDPDKLSPFHSNYSVINFWVSLYLLISFYFISMIVIHFGREKNTASLQKEFERYHMQRQLLIDDLTEIYNRNALRHAFERMEGDTSQNSYAFVMIDLDNFKALNDTLGHDKGDQCLTEFGSILRKYCKGSTVPFRYGGDEFCILFKNQSEDSIVETCKQIQCDLKESAINPPGIVLTASIGIAHYTKPITATQLLQNTDLALYRSKISRDAVCVYHENMMV